MSTLYMYFDSLRDRLGAAEVTDKYGAVLDQHQAIQKIVNALHEVRDEGGKNIFIGNGGSAAIASHMAIDYSKNGRLPSMAFNDGASLTCLGNDLGYENVFAEQLKLLAKPEDQLFAISSSGSSPNILSAVDQARKTG